MDGKKHKEEASLEMNSTAAHPPCRSRRDGDSAPEKRACKTGVRSRRRWPSGARGDQHQRGSQPGAPMSLERSPGLTSRHSQEAQEAPASSSSSCLMSSASVLPPKQILCVGKPERVWLSFCLFRSVSLLLSLSFSLSLLLSLSRSVSLTLSLSVSSLPAQPAACWSVAIGSPNKGPNR